MRENPGTANRFERQSSMRAVPLRSFCAQKACYSRLRKNNQWYIHIDRLYQYHSLDIAKVTVDSRSDKPALDTRIQPACAVPSLISAFCGRSSLTLVSRVEATWNGHLSSIAVGYFLSGATRPRVHSHPAVTPTDKLSRESRETGCHGLFAIRVY